MKNTSANLLWGAVGLLAVNSPMLGQSANSDAAQVKMETLNAASLKSIESTWLKVPIICKARGFNADAVQVDQREARHSIQAIYASYEA